MLLSHFSSFLEVITGVYVSMCMDDVLKGLWSPKYYEDLGSALKGNYIEGHDEFVQRIVETNKNKAESIKNYMKNRAVFFFSVCLIILLLCGYENYYCSSVTCGINDAFFLLACWTAILLLFNKCLFSTKQRTTFAIFLLVTLFVSTYYLYKKYTEWHVSDDMVLYVVLPVLILPVLWQAFLCWMFSSVYKGYIRDKLEKGKYSYELARKGLEEHKPEIIPERYKEFYTSLSIQSNNAEKAKRVCLDMYQEWVESEIAKASNPSSVLNIFLSWVLFHLYLMKESIAILMHIKKRKTITQQQQ